MKLGPDGLPLWNADDPKKPYGDVEYADPGYQEDGKKRYPIDTEEHVRAAWSYINQEDNASAYTSEQLGNIKSRIKRAAKKFGIEIAEDSVSAPDPRERLRRPLARLQNSRTDWYRIQNKANERAAVYIYDEIGFFGDSASSFVNELRNIDADEMDLHLNSPGGDIFDGLAIYQALKNHKAKVTVRVDGLAASIASVIAMAGDHVVMAPKASMMIHEGWTMAVGNTEDLRKTAELLDKQSTVISSVYADRTGQPADFWRDRMRDETWYNAQEALDAGLVDEVEGLEKRSKADEPFDLSVFAHAGRESAPEPVTTPPAPAVAKAPPEAVPAGEKEKPVTPAFAWDFAGFKAALQEGVKR